MATPDDPSPSTAPGPGQRENSVRPSRRWRRMTGSVLKSAAAAAGLARRPLTTPAVPEEVRKRFVQVRNHYYFPDGTRAFTDRGHRLTTPSENTEVVRSLVAIRKGARPGTRSPSGGPSVSARPRGSRRVLRGSKCAATGRARSSWRISCDGSAGRRRSRPATLRTGDPGRASACPMTMSRRAPTAGDLSSVVSETLGGRLTGTSRAHHSRIS